MPIYEYVCRSCEHPFEELVTGSETPACPACGSEQLARQLSTFAVGDAVAQTAPGGAPGACGTCGDPAGPGACAFD